MSYPSFRTLIEKVMAEDANVRQIRLPVDADDLGPVFSKSAIDLHYGVLYRSYVKKSLAGEGSFQTAGAKLHTLFFEQFQRPKTSNNPRDAISDLIEKKFKDYESFKEAVSTKALEIHGSGWVYVDIKGNIKTIPNHEELSDVAVIIDMWEHSYIIDYGANKERYLKDIWKIINWDIVNARLNGE